MKRIDTRKNIYHHQPATSNNICIQQTINSSKNNIMEIKVRKKANVVKKYKKHIAKEKQKI